MRPLKIFNRKIKYQNPNDPILKIVAKSLQFYPNIIKTWDYPEIADGVCILAINNKEEIFFVREWCFPWDKFILGLPSGKIFPKNQKPVDVVTSELQEELGVNARRLSKLGEFYVTAGIKKKYHLFLAENLYKSKKDPDEFEDIEIIKMSLEDALRLFTSGKEITTGNTLAALFMYRENIINKYK